MRESVNKRLKDDFVSTFMMEYRSPGVRVPYIRMIYGKKFELVEMKNSYKVTVGNVTKRANNLCYIAEFLYDRCFDMRYVYISPHQQTVMEKYRENRDKITKKWFDKMICVVKKNSPVLAPA